MRKLNNFLWLSLGASIPVIFYFIKFKEENTMAMVYVSLIVKGKKTFAQVPDKIKEEVRQILIDIDCEYLIEE